MDRFGVIAVTFERFEKWMCAEEKLKECLSVFYFSKLGKKVRNLEYWFLRGSLQNRLMDISLIDYSKLLEMNIVI